MKKLREDKIFNKINVIIEKKGNEEFGNNIIYISKPKEVMELEFTALVQALVSDTFDLTLCLRVEKGRHVYKTKIEEFTLGEKGFFINSSSSNGTLETLGECKNKTISFQVNHKLNIKLTLELEEGIYELSFDIKDNDEEKVLSICPIEVKIK